MTITLNTDYDVALSTALLGYVGETNARPVSVEGLTVDGADRYILTIDYGDGTVYEVDITGGTWTPTADILRSAQTVSCQICAKKLSGDEYILVKKSRIFRLRIGSAIGDNAVPSPDVSVDALDRIDAIGRQAHADMQTAVTATQTASKNADFVSNAKIAIDEAKTDIDAKYIEISNTATKLDTEYNNLTSNYYTKKLANSTFATKTEINNTNTEVSELKEDLDDLRIIEVIESRNKFDKNSVIIGLLKNDGTVGTSNTIYTSDFIPISESENYRFVRWNNNCTTTPIRAVMLYDAQKQPVLSERLNDFNGIGTPVANTAFIRISIVNDYLDNGMLFIGDTSDSTRYIPYEKRREISLNPSINLNDLIEKNEPLKSIAQSCIEQISDEYKVGSYYINSNCVISKSSNWEMYILKNVYEKIIYRGYCSKEIYAIGFYSDESPSDSSFISGITPSRSIGTYLNEFILTDADIPSGTVSILLCSKVTSGNIYIETKSFGGKKYIKNSCIRIDSIESEINGKGNVKAIYRNVPNSNDFTIVKDEIWFAENIYENGVATDFTAVHRYKLVDGFLVKIGDIDTDFGHWNSVDYCEDNDCLVFGNGANSVETEGNYFTVVKNPLALGDVARIETCGIKYHVDIGFKVQAVWGDSNFGENNIVYLISNSCQKITKVLLLKDSNGNFNGQYVTLETKDIELGKYYGVGGADFWGDTLYIGIGGPYEMFKMSMSDYSIQKITKHFYKDDGSEYNGSTQGVHIDSQYIWVFSNIAGSSVNYLTQYRR